MSRRSVTGLYVALLVVTVAVFGLVLGAGGERETEKAVAGTYTVAQASPCLGKEFELKQSGRFVSLGTPEGGSPSAQAKLDGEELTGDLKCLEGGDGELEATVTEGRVTGIAAGEPFEATVTGDPPAPGAKVERAPDSVAGEYSLSPRSDCLGGRLEIEESGSGFELHGGEASGEARYSGGVLAGEVDCGEAGTAELEGEASGRKIDLVLAGSGGGEERLTAQKTREFGETLAVFFLAVVAVMLAARLFGAAAVRIGQPRVMGEVVAGISLGPTILGAVLPDLQGFLFPQDILPFIGVVANLGLIFYMFLVGLELDPAQLRGRVGQAAAISNASVALPMVLGVAVAVPVYSLVGPPDTEFLAFALYIGVAMSITAFPVLARILVERRMLKRPVGALALACAAIDDVTAWVLIALATTVAVAGSASEVVKTMALAVLFCLVMGFAVRPLLARVSQAYDEAGRVPPGWIVAIFAGILLSAYTTEEIGIALIFGAFIMGMIMPRRAELTEDVTRRVEDFVVTLLLPLFFAFTGLRTDIGLLDRPELWLLTLVLIARSDRRQAHRRHGRGADHRLRLALVGGHRGADEHARAHRADRAQPRARGGRDLRGAVCRAGDHGARHDLHGRPRAEAARPPQRARRARRGGTGRGSGTRHVDLPLAAGARTVDPRRPPERCRAGAAARHRAPARALNTAARADPGPPAATPTECGVCAAGSRPRTSS